MKAIFNGNVYEMPQSFSTGNYTIINRIITEIEDPEFIPFFVKNNEDDGIYFMHGRIIRNCEE